MEAAKLLDEQINLYLSRLNERQKVAVLTVIKAFAEESEDYDHWKDQAFIAELDRRTAEYETGNAKLYTLGELEAGARKSFKNKKEIPE